MLRKAQEGDSALRPLLGWLEAGAKPEREEAASLSSETRNYWLNFELMELVDNVVYLNSVDTSGVPLMSKKLVVPSGLRGQVLQSCHNNLFSAHLGVRKTVDKIRQRFHWPGLRRDVKQHIRSCAICTANKMPYRKFRAQLADFRVGAPMDRVALDLLGPVPMSNNGNCYILVLVDCFTRWVEAFPIPDQCAETVAHKMVCDFICRFGTPLETHSDQGRNFENQLFQQVCQLLEVTKTRSSPYHPSGNGLVERFNHTLGSMIRSYLDGSDKDWDLYIPLLTAAYRAAVHPSMGFTPNFLMLGRETATPTDVQFPRLSRPSRDIPLHVQELQERMARCYEIARQELRQAAERQQKSHDTRLAQHPYVAGQAVMKRSHNRSKFHMPWMGHFIIKKKLSDCLLLIADKKKT